MTWYTVKKKDAYGCVIYQKSPFTPPNDDKKLMLSKISEKKNSIPKHKKLNKSR